MTRSVWDVRIFDVVIDDTQPSGDFRVFLRKELPHAADKSQLCINDSADRRSSVATVHGKPVTGWLQMGIKHDRFGCGIRMQQRINPKADHAVAAA